jgi:hypothetical protein
MKGRKIFDIIKLATGEMSMSGGDHFGGWARRAIHPRG